jgi:hypothetical protein
LALGLPVDLAHGAEVNDVAKANGSEVDPGVLLLIGVLDGDTHFHIVGCPGTIVILPLPNHALPGSRGRVIVVAANWTEGPCQIRSEESQGQHGNILNHITLIGKH